MRLLILLIFGLISFPVGKVHSFEIHPGAWSVAMYGQYTYQSFVSYKPAQQKINLKDVDYLLLNAAVFYETNRQRVLHKLPQLLYSPAIEKVAQSHSFDMVKYNFYNHESIVAGKKTLTDRLRKVGIIYGAWAENLHDTFGIAYKGGEPVYTPKVNGGYFSYEFRGTPIEVHTYLSFATAVVKGWMESPGHRDNLLNATYKYIGCGHYLYYDSSFHNMPMFKATQNFSTVSGR